MSASDYHATRPVLSVAMIVRNAADLLPETLDSIRHIADEIVVLDTGSLDPTVRVARGSGATVVETGWEEDFAVARNECIQHVTGNWILWLDAGETLAEEPAQQLRNFVDQDANPDKAYMLFVQVPSNNQQLSGEQIGQLRLIPRRPELRFVGPLRETQAPSVLDVGMEIDALPCQIQRGACDIDPRIKAAKAERNLRIIERAEAEGTVCDSVTLMLARAEAYQNLSRSDAAADCFRKTVELAPSGSSVMLEAYYGLLTSYDGRPEAKETQIATCLEALDIYPLDAQLLCGMGSYLLNQGRLDLAARSYEIAATHGQIDPATWHLADITEVATTCLSLTHQLLDRPDEAVTVLQQALNQRPDSMRLRRQLVELLVKNVRRDEAMVEIDKLPKDLPNREALRSAVRGALLAAEKDFLAAEPYLKTAFSAGCRDMLCLRWLVVTYLSNGKIDAVEPVLAEWRAVDPQNAEAKAYLQALTDRREKQMESSVPRMATMPTGTVSARPSTGQPDRTIRVDEPAGVDRRSLIPRSVTALDAPDAAAPVG